MEHPSRKIEPTKGMFVRYLGHPYRIEEVFLSHSEVAAKRACEHKQMPTLVNIGFKKLHFLHSPENAGCSKK